MKTHVEICKVFYSAASMDKTDLFNLEFMFILAISKISTDISHLYSNDGHVEKR